MNEAATAYRLRNAPGAQVLDNDGHRLGRDGIFVIASQRNAFRGNRFRDLRFAVHYMYTNDSEVSDNVSTDGNTVGFAIMYSPHLKVRDIIQMATATAVFFSTLPTARDRWQQRLRAAVNRRSVGQGAASAVWRRKSMAYHHYRTVPN